MPLARIITRSPQDTMAASEYLRSQGYTVETVSPEEFRVTPAELQLDLEKCRPDEALARAKALLESRQGTVPAETGASQPQPQKAKIPVAYDIAGRPIEFADEEEILPERRQRPNSVVRALVSMIARGKQGVGSGLAGAWQSVVTPFRDFQRNRGEQRALKLEAELAQEREEIRREEELARERVRQEIERQRKEAELAERRREQIAAEKEADERRRIAPEKAAAEQRARQRVETERAAALAAQREQTRIDAEQQAAALRAEQEAMIAGEREAAPVQQQQVQQQVNPPQPVADIAAEATNGRLNVLPPAAPKSEREPAAAKDAAPQQPPHRRVERGRPILVRRRRAPIAISRKAVATAFGASLLLLLGFVAYANRRAASPISPGALMKNQSVQQNVPFGAATITPAPKPYSAAVAPAKTSPAVRPAAQKPHPAQRSARRLRPQSQDDSVAEDEVVVRHLQSSRSKPQPTSSSAKLKRYSDAE